MRELHFLKTCVSPRREQRFGAPQGQDKAKMEFCWDQIGLCWAWLGPMLAYVGPCGLLLAQVGCPSLPKSQSPVASGPREGRISKGGGGFARFPESRLPIYMWTRNFALASLAQVPSVPRAGFTSEARLYRMKIVFRQLLREEDCSQTASHA